MFLDTRSLLLWSLAAVLEAQATNLPSKSKPIVITQHPLSNAGIPLDSFVSFSFELSSWPDFAGNLTHPNKFSYNLMNNIGQLQGSMPIARVGGNTQDIAIFDASQKTGLVGVIRPNISADYPTIITIGPSFFDSYKTMPNGTRFTHGFNMGANSSAARKVTYESAAYACKAIGSNLLYWEYGNEPDLFHASGYRPGPGNWSEANYVDEWLNGTSSITKVVREACPHLAKTKFMAPSFAGVAANDYFTLDPVKAFQDNLDADANIGIISSHNYMGVSTAAGITLQGTLMNHTNVIAKAAAQLNVAANITALGPDKAPKVPFILGEHNSLARQGRPGLSNSFGAALWGVDWNLYLASQNISRSHMHQGTNYRYQSWQPITTNLTSIGTKPPYYGNLAVAAMLHKPHPSSTLHITSLPASSELTSFYTAHTNTTLSRILIIDLHTYNTTSNYTTPFTRPLSSHMFTLPKTCKSGKVQRLMANGSDATTGITWDAKSFAYELEEGKGVRLDNVTSGEVVMVDQRGGVVVEVPWSSAALVTLEC
ncbi:hypothetical protein E4T48_06437 [Aureobasidium sp. EXF-10727]|nr:hypothetical protein E4T48_06437 [Aureobasidium sp. EXF-10727]